MEIKWVKGGSNPAISGLSTQLPPEQYSPRMCLFVAESLPGHSQWGSQQGLVNQEYILQVLSIAPGYLDAAASHHSPTRKVLHLYFPQQAPPKRHELIQGCLYQHIAVLSNTF